MNGVVGVIKNSKTFKYAEKVYGKDAIKFSTNIDISKLPQLCLDLYKIYKLKKYKEHFRWIDHVKIVRNDKKLIEKLDEQMIGTIREKVWERVWLSPPEIIDWYDKEGFSYTHKGELYEDIEFKRFLEVKKKEISDINIPLLQSSRIYYHSQSQSSSHVNWTVYKCIYCEVDVSEGRYILVSGNWYSVNKGYSEDIDSQLQKTGLYSGECNFIKYGRINEEDYNKDLYNANKANAALFDRQNIPYGQGHSSIEFCDLYFDNKEFIHVKRYSGSSTLSHLFFQGLTPAYLLKREPDFLLEVNKRLKNKKLSKIKGGFDSALYEVVFAIATADTSKDIRDILPFFSKVALVHTTRDLREAYGYKVSIKKYCLMRSQLKKNGKVLTNKKKITRKNNKQEVKNVNYRGKAGHRYLRM